MRKNEHQVVLVITILLLLVVKGRGDLITSKYPKTPQRSSTMTNLGKYLHVSLRVNIFSEGHIIGVYR